MKYLHVINSLDPAGGGPAEVVKQLSVVAMRMRHQVEIATLDPPESPWAAEFDCPIHLLGPARFKYGYAPRLRQWLQHHAPEFNAVIVDGLWQYHSYATWSVLRSSISTPYFVFPHGMLDPWFRRQYPLKHLKKFLYWQCVENRVLRDARAVLFTAEEERLLARSSFSKYAASEAVINLGTPEPTGDAATQCESFLQRYPALRGKRLLLFLGRIHPKKGCELLIQAFAAVANRASQLQLVIAGPDSVGWQAELAALARRLGVDSAVTWTGMLDGDVKAGALRAAEAFVLPSHQENFGIAVAEALACGLPVLISDKVNIWREIIADRAGLVGEDSVAGTRKLLQDWLALNLSARHAMARRARLCFERRFHIEAAARNLLAELETRITRAAV